MEIISLSTEYMGAHVYLIVECNHAIVIDPSDADMVIQEIEGKKLIVDKGILTHEHCDHCYGMGVIREKYQIPFLTSDACNKNLHSPRMNYSRYFSTFAEICTGEKANKEMPPFTERADETFREEMTFSWEGHDFLVKEIPGHSQGSIGILLDHSILFSGDSLMWAHPVNTRFVGGNRSDYRMIALPWLHGLNAETKVYPGHYESFLLGERWQSFVPLIM